MTQPKLTAHRGRILHCLKDPGDNDDQSAVEYFEEGVLVIDAGKVVTAGPAEVLQSFSDDMHIVDHDGQLIIPGFIDCHVHYPQIDVIASHGHQLLDWLNNYTFPAERAYSNRDFADATATFFVDELLRNGTTTALVFATVHRQSVEAIFSAAAVRNMRLASGKVMMDRNCPDYLQDTAKNSYRDSRTLLEKWHGQGRLHYAITPRFAPTSSDAQLQVAGTLAAEFPDALVHTHLAENPDEVDWVADLFPTHRSYLEVYKSFGLLRERAVFAHCLHLDTHDHRTFASAGASMAFCPGSNLFLGSGLFDLARATSHNIRVGLGTDVGGGTSLSQLRSLAEAYKVLQLQQQPLSSLRGLYLATLGGAEALYMDDKIGNFSPGKEADFIVLNSQPTALMQRRLALTNTISEELFVHQTLGDERSVSATYVMGELVCVDGVTT